MFLCIDLTETYLKCHYDQILDTHFFQKYHIRHFLKNTTRVEIIITISIAVRIRITKALAQKFVQFSTLIVIIISTCAVFLRK